MSDSSQSANPQRVQLAIIQPWQGAPDAVAVSRFGSLLLRQNGCGHTGSKRKYCEGTQHDKRPSHPLILIDWQFWNVTTVTDRPFCRRRSQRGRFLRLFVFAVTGRTSPLLILPHCLCRSLTQIGHSLARGEVLEKDAPSGSRDQSVLRDKTAASRCPKCVATGRFSISFFY